ncbi:MAG: hypothetical protein JWR03_449, partial [Cohnella sp.]|nr:hypothetical protein [Cohnella sp.]
AIKGKGIDRRKGVSGRRQEGCVKALLGFTEFALFYPFYVIIVILMIVKRR